MLALPQRQPMAMAPPRVRVAVVDDSVVVRGLLSRWLSETPAIEVAGTFRSGREIIEALPMLQPRIILLDLDMPDMDGLTALPLILSKSPGTRVIVVSSLSVHGAEMTMRCLMKGATDYLPKPSNHREVSTSADFRQALIAKVLAVGGIRAAMRQQQVPPTPRPTPAPAPASSSALFARTSSAGRVVARPAPSPASVAVPAAAHPGRVSAGARPLEKTRPKVIVIGASTGGPQALVSLLSHMPRVASRIPIVIAQHMPPIFGAIFASHLKQHVGLPACEAAEGKPLKAGAIYLAPGGCHTVIRRQPDGQMILTMLPSEARGPWRPSIDLLFTSAADCFGADALAIALTGMGRDGTSGAQDLIQRGANVIVQDEPSSVVWGIPGSIAEAGLAAAQLPPEKLGELAQSLVEGNAA
ncbi:MAG: chemotaxis-specific protein-glutamate methyltransferase CheB [Beijerinckiaceae bacterium]|nr:chemotaxis-specific protein-glutamate methyltransferase CheB [Beijerinckiaceae bacterium]